MEINWLGLKVPRRWSITMAVGAVAGGASFRENVACFIPRVFRDRHLHCIVGNPDDLSIRNS
jgi:hypothetical protein